MSITVDTLTSQTIELRDIPFVDWPELQKEIARNYYTKYHQKINDAPNPREFLILAVEARQPKKFSDFFHTNKACN